MAAACTSVTLRYRPAVRYDLSGPNSTVPHRVSTPPWVTNTVVNPWFTGLGLSVSVKRCGLTKTVWYVIGRDLSVPVNPWDNLVNTDRTVLNPYVIDNSQLEPTLDPYLQQAKPPTLVNP